MLLNPEARVTGISMHGLAFMTDPGSLDFADTVGALVGAHQHLHRNDMSTETLTIKARQDIIEDIDVIARSFRSVRQIIKGDAADTFAQDLATLRKAMASEEAEESKFSDSLKKESTLRSTVFKGASDGEATNSAKYVAAVMDAAISEVYALINHTSKGVNAETNSALTTLCTMSMKYFPCED